MSRFDLHADLKSILSPIIIDHCGVIVRKIGVYYCKKSGTLEDTLKYLGMQTTIALLNLKIKPDHPVFRHIVSNNIRNVQRTSTKPYQTQYFDHSSPPNETLGSTRWSVVQKQLY